MHNQRLKFIIDRNGFSFDRHYQFRVGTETSNGKWAIMQPAEFKVLTDDEAAMEQRAAIGMSREDCQGLMDELWTVGIRPTEGTGSAGSLAATERHLNDMRALVFKTGAPTK